MKISTNALFDRATQQMGTVQTTLAKSQAQLAAGKQVITPSDAPTQAASIRASNRTPISSNKPGCSRGGGPGGRG